MERDTRVLKEKLAPLYHIGLLGGSGRLGSRLLNIWQRQYAVTALKHVKDIPQSENIKEIIEGFDITDKKVVDNYVVRLKSNGARTLINCAGLVTIDASESERGDTNSPMYQAHVIGAENIATACRDHDIKLLQLSTEYIFDGRKPFGEKYAEDEQPNIDISSAPTWYGLTKAEGEQKILAIYPEGSAIVRVSQVQGSAGGLFLATLRSLKQEKPFTRVSNQLVSAITDVTLAYSLKLIERALHESTSSLIYHISSTDAHTSFDTCMLLAKEYGEEEKIRHLMSPITLEELVARDEQKIIRPKNSVLNVERFQKDFGTSLLGTVKNEIKRFKILYPNL